jgi:hypothetical protein
LGEGIDWKSIPKIDHEKISNRAWGHDLDRFTVHFDLEFLARPTRDAHPARFTYRIDFADPTIISFRLRSKRVFRNNLCSVKKKRYSPSNIPILIAGFALIIAGSACGGGAATEEFPAPAAEATQLPAATEAPATEPVLEPIVQPTSLATSVVPLAPLSQPTRQPAINEARRLTLEFPPQIRLGESDIIRLTLEVDTLGNLTPTAEFEGNVVTGDTLEIPNLYETHNVIAEARLDLAGMDVRPADLISEPLSPGQSVTFFWSIRPQEVGIYRGTAWLHLRFVDKSNGDESRKAVSAQLVEIEAVTLLGLPLVLVRGIGVVGSFLGGVLGFPFLEDILKFVFRKIR